SVCSWCSGSATMAALSSPPSYHGADLLDRPAPWPHHAAHLPAGAATRGDIAIVALSLHPAALSQCRAWGSHRTTDPPTVAVWRPIGSRLDVAARAHHRS